jgi:hypothetical protein
VERKIRGASGLQGRRRHETMQKPGSVKQAKLQQVPESRISAAKFHRNHDMTAENATEKPALPDRLSIDERSPFFNEAVLQYEVGVRFRGEEKTNVYEYCVSEKWVRVEAGKAKDRFGNPLTIKLTGEVEPYYK